MDPVELADDRLVLRAPCRADVPAIVEVCQDADTARWTTVPVPYAQPDAMAWVDEHVPSGWTAGVDLTFAIIDRENGGYLGSITVRPDGRGAGEVGFAVAPWARGRGVCTAALRLVCRWGFDELGLARIVWRANAGNVASRRVAEKVGFRYEGLLRREIVYRGERVDAWVAGLLPGELR
jgi:RimJ/RimL family protein N-acetyltransferase